MANVAEAGHPASAAIPPVHDTGVQLDHPVGVEAGTDACVQKGLVLQVTHGGDGCFECSVPDVLPAGLERALHRGLPFCQLRRRDRAGAAMDDEGRLRHDPQVKPSPRPYTPGVARTR